MRTDFSYWNSLWTALGARGDPQPWHERLVAAYREPTRYYHNLQHLDECLREFDQVRPQVAQAIEVETALWFHDAIYDSHSPTNEEDSAVLMAACLGEVAVPREIIESVAQLIRGTKTHESCASPDAAILIDIDLAILGQPPSRFWEYERAIRAEYAWVPAPTFAQERARILNRFLERGSVFQTETFRCRYEANARKNLRAAIEALRSATP